ncbi:unnamed protein product [Orchesella dallaii]|uniref:Uncharacterized protein n=1 Tax=Orchesella dallaii TaxID=48710 RepID=A0ABP1PLY0_9HEXA
MLERGVGREFRLTKNFTASDVIENESFDGMNCSALGNSQFSQCENIYECNDAPGGGAVSMNTISFLVVYRSVNVTGSLRFRGFALISDSDGSWQY